jgi:ATP-dependent Clp protease ATP-binding subunit ClpC
LEYVSLLLIAIVLAFALVKAWHRRQPAPQSQQPPETQPVAPTPAVDEPSAASDAPAAASTEPLPPASDAPVEAISAPEAPVTPVVAPVVAAAAPGPSLDERLQDIKRTLVPYGAKYAHPRELADQAAFKKAVNLLADYAVGLDTVVDYALGTDWPLACAGLATLAKRKDGKLALDRVMAKFPDLVPWAMYFALAYFLEITPRPPLGAPLVGAKDWWASVAIVPVIFRDYFVRRATLGDAPDFGGRLFSQAASPTPIIKAFLECVDHPLATTLVAQLDTSGKGDIDHTFLSSIGRFWSDQTRPKTLVEPAGWNIPLATAESTLQQSPVRSLLVSGEPLVGKTSFLQLVAESLKSSRWNVFEASGADLMAGQVWFGQLEGRVRQLVDQVTVKKRLIWYVPDLLQLARSGTHQGQSASILDQILPAITAGRLVIWTEASPTGTARLLQSRPALRNILEVIRLEPQSEANTSLLARAVVDRLADDLHITIDPSCAAVALASARQYMNAASFPGSALMLIGLTASRADPAGGRITPADVLKTLSQLTGLPISILDSNERLDLAAIRKFFARRVIGQDEAVASVIDRIAMLKAGLSDPGRPLGVFLFAGPTGTGKTELAKTTAEYLFGSVERLLRLDMSEFQTADSIAKILGDGSPYGETESLISRVRKQPFSVILLDEFEKSHPRIWDLFLQVFDDGRLTDALGQVADFRHCLIILTTNLGATSHQTSGLGFAPAPDAFTSDQVLRAISQTYRPEFQNRLDRVIVFRPLTRDLMRVILHKELKSVLERRGLKDRAWAVEWEASALEFLLERGFSPEMGARPLKRAIEQYVIAPLAATIVERRFPEGDQFVFFRSDGRAIQAEFVDPDSDARPATVSADAEALGAEALGAEAPGRPATLPSMILAPRGTPAEFAALAAEAAAIKQTLASPDWEQRKLKLSNEMTAPDFWSRPQRYESLAQLALMDRVAAAAGTADALHGRLARGSGGSPGQYSRELMARLALSIHLVKEGLKDVCEGAAVEVALAVEPAFEGAGSDGKATAAWCRQLRDMYRGWSDHRHMQIAEMPAGPAGEAPLLLIAGFGAHRVLERECGLHVLELADGHAGTGRATARVRLAITPLGDVPPARLAGAIAKAFGEAPLPSAVVRRYRGEPAPLVRSGDGSWRSGRLDAVLRGDFDLLTAADEP